MGTRYVLISTYRNQLKKSMATESPCLPLEPSTAMIVLADIVMEFKFVETVVEDVCDLNGRIQSAVHYFTI